MGPRLSEALSAALGFPLTLPGYGVFLSTALLAGVFLTSRELKRHGLDENQRSSILLCAIVGAIVGAKLLYLAQFWELLRGLPLGAVLRSGFALYGGLLGLGLGTFWSARRAKRSIFLVADAMTPALALGLAVTRVGCFLTGCCYGRATAVSWAVSYPRESLPWLSQVRHGVLSPETALSLTVHPTQIYEVLLGLLLLVMTRARPPVREGRLFLALLGAYAAFRFLEEELRADAGGARFGPLTFSQGVSAVLLLVIAFLWRATTGARTERTHRLLDLGGN